MASNEPHLTNVHVRAELARRGLLTAQRMPYAHPITDNVIIPENDPETITAAFEFITWVEGARCEQQRTLA